ncbi:VOC family protein [Dyadobacter arcticus]|uniref:3-demethylubiquinone-9 3-methyltransferase (Glyoxalase superfamily) n=1 Tax=Dyadobacter arcticus TaxID=1078754 RepID=A0ABX0UTG6_9BACT|nr:VOC family protein [Dyadobacter arcticus]NIJ55080.1 putative 3-demethylubiquinone-9 3-methyltransferase (glyoxalase superfamily) [Dyadobacter arcticus]
MAQKITTFLMFEGQAEEAITFYTSLFPDSAITSISKHVAGEMEGKIIHATFTLNGIQYMAIDSSPVHDFTFTPAMSLFISCESEEEITELYEKLLEGGKALMAIGNYGFSKKFGWVNDRFGVSWQINLP